MKDKSHLKQALFHCNKDLFQKFKSGELTYDQLLSRIEEKRFGKRYVVLDDLKANMDPDLLEPEINDAIIQKALKSGVEKEKLQGERRCIKSIFSLVTKPPLRDLQQD